MPIPKIAIGKTCCCKYGRYGKFQDSRLTTVRN